MFKFIIAAATIGFCLCSMQASAENNIDQDESIKVVNIDSGLDLLIAAPGQGSNVGVIYNKDSIILVDSMVERMTPLLQSTLKKLSSKPVKYIINTHDHFDHTGANDQFSKQGASIIAQENAANDKNLNMIQFEKSMTLKHDSHSIHAETGISHSNNDTLIYLKDSNVLFTGDVFTNKWFPALFAGGLEGQIDILNKILALSNEDTKIVPGHGGIANKKDVERYKENTFLWVNRIMALHNEGKTAQQMSEDKELRRIQRDFDPNNLNRKRMDELFPRLVNNTIKIELELGNTNPDQ